MKTLMEYMEELDDCHNKFEQWFPKHVDNKLMYEQLEESKKFFYFKNTPDEGTELAKKKVAEMSVEYQAHLNGLYEAKEKFMKGFAKIESIKMRIESLRTMISALKQSERSFGG